MSFRVPKSKNDSGASPSYTAPKPGTSEGATTALPQPPSEIPDDLHSIQHMLLAQTRRGFEITNRALRTFLRAEEVAGRSQESAEAIAAANLCLERHWETYVDLNAMIIGKDRAADESHGGDAARPAPPS